MIGKIKELWQQWRLRPGLMAAARKATVAAYSHHNTHMMGPEINLLNLAQDLKEMAQGRH